MTDKHAAKFQTLKWALLTVLMSISAACQAYTECFDNWFCIERDQTKNALKVENITTFPVAVYVKFNWRDASGKKVYSNKNVQLDGSTKAQWISLDTDLNKIWRQLNYNVEWVGGVVNAKHDDSVRYKRPYAPGKKFRIVQGFSGGFSHWGASRYAVDFAMPVGTPIHAARDGVVIDVVERHNRGGPSRRYAQYANFIVLLHEDGTTGEYYHLQRNGAVVERGDSVEAGQFIGYSGNTGFSSLPHLHFAVYQARKNGKYQSLPFKFEQSVQNARRKFGD